MYITRAWIFETAEVSRRSNRGATEPAIPSETGVTMKFWISFFLLFSRLPVITLTFNFPLDEKARANFGALKIVRN